MKKIFFTLSSLVLAITACTSGVDYTQYVDTKIGTGAHGHVFVGANIPFGMVQLGPTSVPQSWDWCSGYHESDSTVIGFSHTHISGSGIGDLFDITVMPVVGKELTYDRGNVNDQNSGIWSYADRTKEVSRPGYYSVPLMRYGINAELTATDRVGLMRFTFPQSDEAAVVFDLQNGGCHDKVFEVKCEKVADNAVQGFRRSKGWAKDHTEYFYAEFSRPVESFELCGNDLFGRCNFTTKKDEQILVKVAISPVSSENAKLNMDAELPHWNFAKVEKAAKQAWNEELSKFDVTTTDETARTIFYTSYYHTMISPVHFSDVDGSYRGSDGQVYNDPDFVNYTIFSLWDTYRAQMPLFTIIHPEKENDVIKTFIHIYEQQGKLPVWHLKANETNCMVGNPGISVVADAILKGFDGFDVDKAYEAMVVSAKRPDRGQQFRMEYGYIPFDKMMGGSVAHDMEYAIADWAIAQVAKRFLDEGKEGPYAKDYEYFMNRSKSYKNFFDPSTMKIRGKDSNGKFIEPFNPYYSEHNRSVYTEGNAWQYTWLVPHDMEGLMECFGSKEAFIDNLDSLFNASTKIDGENASPDMTGLIGQYVHGNEPSHHIIYFYTRVGQPEKTADLVRHTLKELYLATPDGVCGNEDCGEMSAWYILSAIGLYQMEPAGGRFFFGSPIFDQVELKLPEGKTFTIKAEGVSDAARYIKSVTFNGETYDKNYIDYADIMAGGELCFTMSETY